LRSNRIPENTLSSFWAFYARRKFSNLIRNQNTQSLSQPCVEKQKNTTMVFFCYCFPLTAIIIFLFKLRDIFLVPTRIMYAYRCVRTFTDSDKNIIFFAPPRREIYIYQEALRETDSSKNLPPNIYTNHVTRGNEMRH